MRRHSGTCSSVDRIAAETRLTSRSRGRRPPPCDSLQPQGSRNGKLVPEPDKAQASALGQPFWKRSVCWLSRCACVSGAAVGLLTPDQCRPLAATHRAHAIQGLTTPRLLARWLLCGREAPRGSILLASDRLSRGGTCSLLHMLQGCSLEPCCSRSAAFAAAAGSDARVHLGPADHGFRASSHCWSGHSAAVDRHFDVHSRRRWSLRSAEAQPGSAAADG